MNLNNSIGIFDAKTHFSQLCDQVSSSGQPLVIKKRGKALVMISPLPPNPPQENTDILTAWERWTAQNPHETDDFPDLTSLRSNKPASPLD